jgi:peptidoglycan/LPS O-acetylase OafA/YrhL
MRNKRLDVLRCIAVLLVMLAHSKTHSRIALAGWVGVDLFFVLSGFLISGLLFDEYKQQGSIGLKRFFIRRGFKIYPSFYVLLFVGFLVEHGIYSHPVSSAGQYLREVLYVQNYATGIWIHTWSLAVEEHFYILLPILLLALLRFARDASRPFDTVPAIFMVIAIVCLAVRIVTASRLSSPDEYRIFLNVIAPTHERIDSLFFGVLLGYLHHFRPYFLQKLARRKWNIVAVAAVSLAMLSPALIFPQGTRFMQRLD